MADRYQLAAGPHRRPGGARCAMEWVAHLAGEEHSDSPATVSPVLAAFARSWNDALDDAPRQRLRPYLARTIATAGDGLDEWRAWLCTDWLVRTCAPGLLDHAGLAAAPLRRRVPLVGDESAEVAEPALRAACAAAARARGEARGAAILVSADGARHAARAVPRTTGSDAARAAVRAASIARAERVAEAACRVARDAAWAAAWRDAPAPWRAMRPVAEALQRSAFGLLDRMLPGELLVEPLEAVPANVNCAG